MENNNTGLPPVIDLAFTGRCCVRCCGSGNNKKSVSWISSKDDDDDDKSKSVLLLWKCTACQFAHYCSKECQIKDWKEVHRKNECKLLTQFQEKYHELAGTQLLNKAYSFLGMKITPQLVPQFKNNNKAISRFMKFILRTRICSICFVHDFSMGRQQQQQQPSSSSSSLDDTNAEDSKKWHCCDRCNYGWCCCKQHWDEYQSSLQHSQTICDTYQRSIEIASLRYHFVSQFHEELFNPPNNPRWTSLDEFPPSWEEYFPLRYGNQYIPEALPKHFFPACTRLMCPSATCLYAMQLIDWKSFNEKSTLTIHVVGASEWEVKYTSLWEECLHCLPNLQTLIIDFIGPDVQHFIPADCSPLFQNRCDDCKTRGRKFYYGIYGYPYHDFLHKFPDREIGLDLIVAYNTGMHELFTEGWKESIRLMLHMMVPCYFTSYDDQDAKKDLIVLQEQVGANILHHGPNPFHDLCWTPISASAVEGVDRFYTPNRYGTLFQGLAHLELQQQQPCVNPANDVPGNNKEPKISVNENCQDVDDDDDDTVNTSDEILMEMLGLTSLRNLVLENDEKEEAMMMMMNHTTIPTLTDDMLQAIAVPLRQEYLEQSICIFPTKCSISPEHMRNLTDELVGKGGRPSLMQADRTYETIHVLTTTTTNKNDQVNKQQQQQQPQRILTRLENFVDTHDGWSNLCHGYLRRLVSTVLGKEMVLYKEKLNLKPPGGSGYAPHLDTPSLRIAFGANGPQTFCTVMVAIDDASKGNGCLRICKGPWNEEDACDVIQPEQDGNPDAGGRAGAIPFHVAETLNFEDIVCKSGTIVMFNGWAPHRSAANATPYPRRAVFLTYNCKNEGDFHKEYYHRMERLRMDWREKVGLANPRQRIEDDNLELQAFATIPKI